VLVKAADDRQADTDILTSILERPGLAADTKQRVETELRQIRAGAAGERDAAYEIEFHYGANPNRMTIHDLRIEVAGRVAQIDHLLVDRLVGIWICESKHFSEGVAVDEFGEWTGFYRRRPYGIGSPIEQNRKHAAVVTDVFAKGIVKPPTRLGVTLKPTIRSLVLVSKGARISRPKTAAARAKIDGLESVIKVDQVKALMDKDLDSKGVMALRRFISQSEVERLARELVALHRPITVDWAARFGVGDLPSAPAGAIPAPAADPPVCQACGKRVSQAVIDFCEARAELFGGRTLCMDCQRLARKARLSSTP